MSCCILSYFDFFSFRKYKERLDLRNGSRPRDGEKKPLKLRSLVFMANHHDMWTLRLPPKSTDTARPLDTTGIDSTKPSKEKKFHRRNQVGVNTDKIVAVCRLLSLRAADGINLNAVEYLRDG